MARSAQAALRPVERRSLAQAAYQEIAAAIFERRFPPRSRLNVYELSRQLGMSPTPVREALSAMAADDLIWQETNRGFRVAPLLTEAELQSLFDVRRALEMLAIRQANLDPIRIRKLSAIAARMDRMRYGPDFHRFDEYNRADADFHRGIVELAASPFLESAWDGLHFHVHVGRLAVLPGSNGSAGPPVPPEHRLIIQALAEGDRRTATRRLDEHIRRAREAVLSADRAEAGNG